jgi:hypothetical protein
MWAFFGGIISPQTFSGVVRVELQIVNLWVTFGVLYINIYIYIYIYTIYIYIIYTCIYM